MEFSLIICTYNRPKAITALINSIKVQSLYPNEIIIVDGSDNDLTKETCKSFEIAKLHYYKVDEKNRGLTKQRNIGISKVAKQSDVICFLDDDVILEKDYFKELLATYTHYPKAIAVGGYITNEVAWEKSETYGSHEFYIDGFKRTLGSRNEIRKKLGLHPDCPPCSMPTFSHGFSVSYLPPSNKIYKVEYFMGGVSSYKKEVFENVKFSEYFEGYGLYEDLDFCLRIVTLGNLYVNTKARLEHHHASEGRPNLYTYGKMVVRNGWYVWRIKFPTPSLKDRFKWNSIVVLQFTLRFFNIFSSSNKWAVFTEVLGRKMAWVSLLFQRPKLKR